MEKFWGITSFLPSKAFNILYHYWQKEKPEVGFKSNYVIIEKDQTSKTPQYRVSIDTIKYLGLNKITELPNFEEIRNEIDTFIYNNSQDATQ